MTGYGRAEGQIGNSSWVVEIKTVNHRFLDIYLKIPRLLVPFEIAIKKYLGTQ
ncbi:MAG: YicC family protein, partial [Desulfobacterota bacterium]|nr:YicC family protein [Thermodesulfobacteriota bacterium]